ncbi:MAG: hypothetical protein QM770_04015 [Tepidisphaeraceae bacterium]
MPFDIAHLSAKAQHVLSIDAATAYRELVPTREGSAEARDILESIKPVEVVASMPADLDAAKATLSGLWLWHDFLDASHTLSQSIETPTGSFWHGVMHRREGDFGNAKYWYRRCPNHPAYASIAAKADTVIKPAPADKLLLKLTINGWDPFAFVDAVEALHDKPESDERRKVIVELQRIEWQTLMEFSSRAATGK